ncbi:MAG: transcription antitermination factor NusB [Azospirillaceae bacterium]
MTSDQTTSTTARRSAARLYAVQALYQIAQTGQPVDDVLKDFVRHRLGGEQDGDRLIDPDRPLFGEIVRGVSARTADVDGLFGAALSKGYTPDRLELLLRLILRAGTWELLEKPATDARIIITDYVDLAHAFFSEKEPGIVNAVMDRVARTLRPDEMTAAR